MNVLLLALMALHEQSVSSSKVEIAGREARVTFTFSLEDLAELARLDADRDGIVETEEWAQVLPSIFSYLGRTFRIDNGGDPCRSEGDGSLLPPAVALRDSRARVTIRMGYVSARTLDRMTVRCDLFGEHGGNPRHVAEWPGGRTVVFDKDRRQVDDLRAAPASLAGITLPFGAGAAALLLAALLRAARQRPKA